MFVFFIRLFKGARSMCYSFFYRHHNKNILNAQNLLKTRFWHVYFNCRKARRLTVRMANIAYRKNLLHMDRKLLVMYTKYNFMLAQHYFDYVRMNYFLRNLNCFIQFYSISDLEENTFVIHFICDDCVLTVNLKYYSK